jgi:hypothetical protein
MTGLAEVYYRFLFALTLVLCASSWSSVMQAATVRLSWDANSQANLAGYKVYYGTASHSYDTSIYVGNTTTYAVASLNPGTYYFAVTAWDTSGNESGFSNEVAATLLPGTTITQVTLSGLTESSVIINWTTDHPTTGTIRYGTSALDKASSESSLVLEHETQLTGLTPSTRYNYRVTAATADGSTFTSDLLVFKTLDRLNQAAKPSSQAIFLPSVLEGSQFRTNLGINNLSASVANVSITWVDKGGIVLGSKTVQVKPHGLQQINSVGFVLAGNQLGSTLEGNLYLETDQPIYAWASQIENNANDPSLWVGKRFGATRILVPSVANTSGFKSSLAVMNVGTSTALVVIKAYSGAGDLLGQGKAPLSIPPIGLLRFENILQEFGITGDYGPLEIISVNNAPLIASSRVSSGAGGGGFFEGFDYSEASTLETIPAVVDTLQLRTNLGINSASETTAAVRIRLISQDGVEVGGMLATVAARGLIQIDNIVRQLLGQTQITNFQGYIRLESNEPIFGWASVIDNQTNDPGLVQSDPSGSANLLIESAAHQGNFRSSLTVVNLGRAEAAIDIRAYAAGGSIHGQTQGLLIPAGGYFGSDDILGELGVGEGFGPVEIISTNGQPLLATSRVYSTSRTSGFFQGVKVE